jgi:hypothetical protein
VPPQGVEVEVVVLLGGFLEEESTTQLSSDHVHYRVQYGNYVYGDDREGRMT